MIQAVTDSLVAMHATAFNDDTRLTLIARCDGADDADIVISDDDLTEVAAAVARSIDRENQPTVQPSEYKQVTLLVKPDGSYFAISGSTATDNTGELYYPALEWLSARFEQLGDAK